jgi:dihydroorotate dehydrogenase
LIVGVNLGMNKATPLENAASDYLALLRIFTPLADYLAVNVSSPNTAGLRRLQGRQMLADLLAELVAERQYQSDTLGRHVPLLVKVSPDLTNAELDDVLQVLLDQQVDGIIATNTTLARDGLTSPLAGETGGLSGAPLRLRSTWLVREIIQRTGGRLPVIAVGGILSPQDALEKLDAGAVLVQLYTGLIYAGPSLVKKILTA